MTWGITDIGTNTIRAVIYADDGEIKAMDELIFESEILANTEDKKLTDFGIERLIFALNKAIEFFSENKVDKIHFFATSAMRDVENFSDVNEAVLKACKTEIELLEEKEEILCDFYGIKLILGENCSGMAIDLGGGSCQVIAYENGELVSGKSLKIGVKRLYKMFERATFEEMTEYIKKELGKIKMKKCNNIYVMGGTSKNILKTLKILNPDTKKTFDVCEIKKIARVDFSRGEFEKIYQNRVNTINYGVAVIENIAKMCNARTMTVINSDARKGYIMYKKGK